VFTRPTKILRPPLAVPPRPGPAPGSPSHLPRLWVTRHQRGFTHVRPSGLPLACAPGWNGTRFGFFPELRTPQLPATHVRAGTGLEHWPGTTPPTSSALQSAHSLAPCSLVSHAFGPDVTDGGGGDGVAAVAAEDPAVKAAAQAPPRPVPPAPGSASSRPPGATGRANQRRTVVGQNGSASLSRCCHFCRDDRVSSARRSGWGDRRAVTSSLGPCSSSWSRAVLRGDRVIWLRFRHPRCSIISAESSASRPSR